MMIPQSLRWRLPFSYAAIAAIATLALGLVLLTTLRNFYSRAEMNYLRNNAEAAGVMISRFATEPHIDEIIKEQLQTFSFLSQTRIQLLDDDKNVLQDTGLPNNNYLAFDRRANAGRRTNDVTVPFSDYQIDPDNWDVQTWVYAAPTSGESLSAATETVNRFRIEIFSAVEDESLTIVEDHIILPTPMGPFPEDQLLFFPARRTLFGFDLNDNSARRSTVRRSSQAIELPLPEQSSLTGYIRLSAGPAYGSEILDSVAQGWLVASMFAVVLAALVGFFISQRLTAPLLSLTTATTKMTAGDLSARAAIISRDEVGTLARSFNDMAIRLEETIVTLRRFVADAAHELHTPLTALRTNLELLTSEQRDQQQFTFVEAALAQVQRLESLTTDLLELSRLESISTISHHESMNLTQLIQETAERYASQAEQLGIDFQLDLPADTIFIRGDILQFRRALGNLLDNALKFTHPGGTVNLSLTRLISGNIEISVRDTGIGIPPDELPQLFSRFHRGRNAAAYPGSGLGLAIVKAIVDAHNGTITAHSLANGTHFTLQIPAI